MIYLPYRESCFVDQQFVRTLTKLSLVTTDKICFISAKSTLSTFIFTETVYMWQSVRYQQVMTNVFTLLNDRQLSWNRLDRLPDQFHNLFDLSSNLQASHNFIYPEITNSSVFIEFTFSAAIHAAQIYLLLAKKT